MKQSHAKSNLYMQLRNGLLYSIACVLILNMSHEYGHSQTANTDLNLSESLADALSYFDRADYETAIIRLSEHGKKFAAESGIAYYFVAESHYNLALKPKILKPIRIEHLKATIQYLNYAAENGLNDTYPEKADEVIYKRAWANFRLSELECNPIEYLTEAYNDFDFIAGGPTDRMMTHEGAYMAAETLIRKALIRQIILHRSINAGEQISIMKEIKSDLRMATNHLDAVSRSTMSTQYLKAVAQFQLQNIKIILAKTLIKLDQDVYDGIRDEEFGETSREAVLQIIQSVNLHSVSQNLSQAMAVQLQPLLQYEIAYIALFEYMITGENVFNVNVSLDSISKPLFRSDYLFFQGNRDHKADIEEQRFIQLSKTDESFYNEVSTVYSEALYWLGWVQYILGEKDSETNFQKYLSTVKGDACDLRINYLKEDAQMRLYYLAFDKNATKPGQLKSLKQSLTNFHPTVPELRKERELLLSLVRVGLGEQAGSIFNTVDEVVELIRYMLPKAALVYGRERAQYLKYLDSLLKITQYQKSDQAAFYQGIVAFLRAEIQPEDKEVLKFYIQAAGIMKELQKGNNKYRYEAQYITARAYFDAAKHEVSITKKEKLYQDAKQIFIRLVKEQQSVRSLFYLAEIFIHENNHTAAAECYQAIINATCRHDDGKFWCSSARAGLRNARNRGNVSAIQGIPIDNVRFPENLNKVDDEEITLEQFGYQKYVMKKLWDESISRLLQFGLPNRQLYPAKVQISDSRYLERNYEGQTAGLVEQIIGLKSGLILDVVLPADLMASEQSVLVFYNGKLLQKEQYGYHVEEIPLNERAVLEITNERCYNYRKVFRFTQPRQMKLTIPLIQKFRFRRINHTPDIENHLIHFTNRMDKNSLFISGDRFLETSDLYQQFDNHLYFRDFKIAGDRILAVKDSANFLIQYQLDGNMPKEIQDRIFPLDLNYTSVSLRTPEGIDVDSSGNIYITDVDKNHCLVFDSNGRFRLSIGGNTRSDSDSLLHVSFNCPKRIALAEDTEGIRVGDNRIYRPTLIFVTDRGGIHVTNIEGDLLEFIPNSEDQPGIFYDLMVTGYGKRSQVFVWNRKTGKVEWFKAEPASR